ncbi:RNA polymerase sigma-70 factor, ECF subfamily [Novosphingobium sp. CF614]|uniref:RNA polymerase sigma factor n=1 Tax=Novosphingobium sp. CF614 TaxID=1884364 RepID=UPI0008EB24C9|nr:RNA polymerase sigma factor [Novosphingobium sp. CF614]SFG29500.1 RNA polymerase sigma-70 factor, ECF subfamily [Novosphingobium sp. CF614]
MQKKLAIALSDEDQMVLEQLSRHFRGSLLRYFGRRTKDMADREDMVQEVFVRLIRRGGTSALAHENLSGYVFETASSVLKDRLRKHVTHRVEAHEPFDSDRHSDVDFSPEHVLLGKERLARATAVLLELPERTRVIFVLRRLEGMRFNEIAARLGISVSAVEKHMQRAVTHLMRRIEQE